MATGIGAKIELNGASSFNSGMKLATEMAKNLRAQMQELSSQFGTTGKSSEELTKRNELLGKGIEQQKDKAALLTKELDNQRGKLSDLGGSVDKAKNEYEQSRQKVEQATEAYGKNSKEVQQATAEQENSEVALTKAANAYTNQATQVEKLERQYSNTQTQINNMTGELSKNETTIRDIERGYNDAGNKVDEFGKELDDAGKKDGSVLKIATAFGAVELAIDLAKSAVSTLKSHLGDAIDRFDTLNNFPKILTQMGYGADQAEAATQRLSDGVQGLPTSLDSVVDTAQRLTILTGNLESATDTTIALNNAFIASGSDASKAERGLEQYVKMLSSGKVNLQSWTTLQETMGLALNETAESFGFAGASAQNDLYEALQSGDITFEQFNSRIVELSDGVDGFAERARTASGGIRTTLTNIKTAITRNLTDALQELDASLANTSFGSIEGVLNSVKDGVNDVLGRLVEVLPKILTTAANLYNTIKPFIPLIVGIVSALATLSAIDNVTRYVQKLKAGIEGVNKVVGLLIAHPVIAIIAAVVAAVIYLWNTNEDFRNGLIAIWESIVETLSNVVAAIGAFFTETLPNAFNAFTGFLKDVFERDWTDSFGILGIIINGFRDNIKDIWDGIKGIFTGLLDFIKNAFTGNWRGAWQAVVDIFKSVFNTLVSIAKAPINGVISLLNTAIGGINVLINGLNKIKLDIPSWLGGGSFGINIPQIPQIPRLAKGAVIEPGKEFLAILGDQRRGYNIETPESLMRQVVREESSGSPITMNVVINSNGSESDDSLRDMAYKLLGYIEEGLAESASRRVAATGGV